MNFIRKHKILISVTSVILLLLITLIILMFTVFSLKKVEVNLLTETNIITEETLEDIKKEINLGGTVLFKDKEEITNHLEEKYPYLKVINIETVIPNKFVLHVAEREEVFAIKGENNYLILDRELKILKIVENFESTKSSAVLINIFNLDFNFATAKEGSFLNIKNISNSQEINALADQTQQILTICVDNFEINNKSVADFRAMISTIQFNTYKDYQTSNTKLSCVLKDFSGFEISILNPTLNFEDKISKMLYVYASIYTNNPSKLTTHKLTVYTNQNNENVVVVEEK